MICGAKLGLGLALAAVVLATAGGARAQAAYQGTKTSDYSHGVQVKGQPQVFISNLDYSRGLQAWINMAQVNICRDKPTFDKAIAELDKMRDQMDQNYQQNTQKAAESAAAGLVVSAAQATAQAQRSLDDANSIASTIVWLKAAWAACTPPKKDPPPAVVHQSGVVRIQLNGGFLGGGVQQTQTEPPPPKKDPTDGETGSVLQGGVLQNNVLGGIGVTAARPAQPNRVGGDSQTQTQTQPAHPMAHSNP